MSRFVVFEQAHKWHLSQGLKYHYRWTFRFLKLILRSLVKLKYFYCFSCCSWACEVLKLFQVKEYRFFFGIFFVWQGLKPMVSLLLPKLEPHYHRVQLLAFERKIQFSPFWRLHFHYLICCRTLSRFHQWKLQRVFLILP